MSSKKENAYGNNAPSDTARRTWDTTTYLAKARERETARREEGAARAEARAEGRTWHRKQLDPSTARETQSRASRLDVGASVGKVQLIPAGSAVGKRGRGAGFYCADCDLTFKDNLQFVEHLNSKQHLVAIGEKSVVSRATVGEVRERIRWLAEKKRMEREEEGGGGGGGAGVDLAGRLKRSEEVDERKREERRRKRRERRRAKGNGGGGNGSSDDDGAIRGGIIC